jgi:hypothetical protein
MRTLTAKVVHGTIEVLVTSTDHDIAYKREVMLQLRAGNFRISWLEAQCLRRALDIVLSET